MAFAFGPQHGWQRFTVFFLCADGATFALCPVAPFGAALPSSTVQNLADGADTARDLAHSATTEAWIQQVGLLLCSCYRSLNIHHDATAEDQVLRSFLQSYTA